MNTETNITIDLMKLKLEEHGFFCEDTDRSHYNYIYANLVTTCFRLYKDDACVFFKLYNKKDKEAHNYIIINDTDIGKKIVVDICEGSNAMMTIGLILRNIEVLLETKYKYRDTYGYISIKKYEDSLALFIKSTSINSISELVTIHENGIALKTIE